MDWLTTLTAPQAALITAVLTASVASASLWFARRDARTAGARTATDIMRTCVETMESINDELRKEITAMKARLAELESERASLLERIAGLEDEREGFLGRIAELETTLATTCQERNQLQRRVDEMDAEITLLRNLLSTAQKRRLSRMLAEAKER